MDSLPRELLPYVFANLPASDLANVARVCRSFWEAVSLESVWQERCRADYNVKEINAEMWTFRSLYTKLLYRHGYLLGVWKCQATDYGGLYKVIFDGEKILGCQLVVPLYPHIDRPLKKINVFSVEMRNDEPTCIYQCAYRTGTAAQLAKASTDDEFAVYNPGNTPLIDPDLSEDDHFFCWLWECRGISEDEYFDLVELEQSSLDSQYDRLWDCLVSCACLRLNLHREPSQNSHPLRPIESGLFKGYHGCHGMEIINLVYNENKLEGWNITGNRHLPAGQINFSVDLDTPMVLSVEQQNFRHTALMHDIQYMPLSNAVQQMAGQPFVFPWDCPRYSDDAPSTCRARFKAEGQIGGTPTANGYECSTYHLAHFIVFDDDWFGFMWMQLPRCFCMYH